MPSYLTPGVHIEEIPSGARPIEGVPTSTTAFVGTPYRGPANRPVRIGTWDDYVNQFSDPASASGVHDENDAMALAVRSFYRNGGRAAYVCRVTQSTSPAPSAAQMTLQDEDGDSVLSVAASSEGDWANELYILVETSAADEPFSLSVGLQVNGTFEAFAGEEFNDLTLDETDESFVEKIINTSSNLIQVSLLDPHKKAPADNTGSNGAKFGDATAGVAASPSASDYLNFYNKTLRKYRDFAIMVLPGQQWAADGSGNAFISNTVTFCEKIMRAVLIVDPPKATELDTPAKVNQMSLPTSTYTTLYYPWVSVRNPLYDPDRNPTASTTIPIPPSGIAAATWTQTDGNRGVWKAPAGVNTRINVSGLQFDVEDLEQSVLNPLGVNCIRTRPGFGPVFWGARTLATKAKPEWRYVPVRRTAIYIEQSIYNGIQWSVFEPNADPLWSSLRANIGSFMNGLFRAGAFQGTTANQAYFVRCGKGDTMTQGDIDRGQVIIVVGFAPLKPAEFVVLRIQQKVNQD